MASAYRQRRSQQQQACGVSSICYHHVARSVAREKYGDVMAASSKNNAAILRASAIVVNIKRGEGRRWYGNDAVLKQQQLLSAATSIGGVISGVAKNVGNGMISMKAALRAPHWRYVPTFFRPHYIIARFCYPAPTLPPPRLLLQGELLLPLPRLVDTVQINNEGGRRKIEEYGV